MEISKKARRHLDTARLLMDSVEESLENYSCVKHIYQLNREDSIGSVHRRLIQIRQEIMAVSREFESVMAFKMNQYGENGFGVNSSEKPNTSKN